MNLFPTSLLLEALAAESPGHTTPSPTDSSAHMPSASDIHDVPSAFRWIIANHYATQPTSPPRSVRIVADKGTCDESECAPHENVVTVHESKVTFWYRPYSEPGAPRFAGYRLHGLFDFMRAVIWERLIDERKIDRFLLEPIWSAKRRRPSTVTRRSGKKLRAWPMQTSSAFCQTMPR